MNKIIWISTTLLLLSLLSSAQVIYFRDITKTSAAIYGGIGASKDGSSYSGGISFGITSAEFGISYEKTFFSFEGVDYSLHSFTPYFEYVFLRKRAVALSAGVGYLFIEHTINQYFPVYANLVLDLAKKDDGFVLLPDLSFGKLFQLGGISSGNTLIGSLGLTAMFRNEENTSIFLRTGISKSSGTNFPGFSLSGGFIFR